MLQRKNFLFMKKGHETCQCIDQVSLPRTLNKENRLQYWQQGLKCICGLPGTSGMSFNISVWACQMLVCVCSCLWRRKRSKCSWLIAPIGCPLLFTLFLHSVDPSFLSSFLSSYILSFFCLSPFSSSFFPTYFPLCFPY